MIKRCLIMVVALCLSQLSFAQIEKVIHQAFEIEEFNIVSLDLFDEFQIEKWAGNTIMTETSIQVYDVTTSIFNFLLEEGRYDILATSADDQFKLASKDKERRTFKVKGKEAYEFVKLRIFIPEDFEWQESSNQLIRQIKETDTDSTKVE